MTKTYSVKSQVMRYTVNGHAFKNLYYKQLSRYDFAIYEMKIFLFVFQPKLNANVNKNVYPCVAYASF